MRAPGDTLFALGALVLVGFVFGLATGHSLDRRRASPMEDAWKGPDLDPRQGAGWPRRILEP